MHLNDLDIHILGENVKALHGDDVYIATLQRALAVATRKSVRPSEAAQGPCPAARHGVEVSEGALTTEAVLDALRTEFLKLLRPN